MRNFIEFIWTDKGYYRREKFTSDEMILLSLFLASDYNVYGFTFLNNWLTGSFQDETHANITYLEKEGDTIIIGDLYEKEPTTRLFLPKKQFLKLIEKWEKLGLAKTKKISVFWNDDTIEVVEGN